MAMRGGGASVVVRGRESRPHGEGRRFVSACTKEKQAVDTDYQADKVWLLDIQRKLYVWSRNHPEQAWRDMWNWLTDPRNLRLAWRRVASNRGARSAGVDGLTVRRIQQRKGTDRFLDELRENLCNGRYSPSPVRRVLIPKRGKPGQFRPLGVPTVADRVVQAAILHLLEPIFEAEFYPVSYGFRPKRSCRDAVEHIRNAIRPPKKAGQPRRLETPYQWVIEGDIKGCFDHIDHHSVMQRLRSRVADVKVGRLVRAFLKAGVLSEGAFAAHCQRYTAGRHPLATAGQRRAVGDRPAVREIHCPAPSARRQAVRPPRRCRARVPSS